MRPYLFIALVLIVACGQNKNQEQKTSNADASLVERKEVTEEKTTLFFAGFVYNDKGIVTDSFPTAQQYHAYVTTGIKQSFPNGYAGLQPFLTDSILVGCDYRITFCDEWFDINDTLRCSNPSPVIETFKPTQGESFFNAKNHLNYYFFLTQIDSNELFAADPQYGLLHFLKLKTQQQKLPFMLKQYKEEYVNWCAMQKVKWGKPIDVGILENNKHYSTSFDEWVEAWECGQKADYAPVYAQLNIKKINGLVKVIAGGDDLYTKMANPQFVFSYICLDESKNELKNIKTHSYPMQLVNQKGKIRKGVGIDFNNDKHADVFWYNVNYQSGPSFPERISWLYIKVDNIWQPIFYLVKNEFI